MAAAATARTAIPLGCHFALSRNRPLLRLVGSIKVGHVAPSVMLRKLAAYERQNQLDVALQEIGKIERTLFMLDWLENPDLRRRCHAGLNNSEQRHALTQAI